jgi:hypothetical protein
MNYLTIFDAPESLQAAALVEVPPLPTLSEILAEVLTPADRELMAKIVAAHAETKSAESRKGQTFLESDPGTSANIEAWQNRMAADFGLEFDFVAMRDALGKRFERIAVAWIETQRDSWAALAAVLLRVRAKVMEYGRARAAAERHNVEAENGIYSPSLELTNWINPEHFAEMAERLTARQHRSTSRPCGVQAVELLTA